MFLDSILNTKDRITDAIRAASQSTGTNFDYLLRTALREGLENSQDWVPLIESVINDLVFSAIAMLFLWAFPERRERRT